MKQPLTIALPKGRLFDRIQQHFQEKGIYFDLEKRKLTANDRENNLKIYLVKNSDLPTYLAHGIAGLGICGEDVIIESGHSFHKLLPFSFGGTNLSLAGLKGFTLEKQDSPLTIATSYTTMTRNYFHNRGIPVKIIRLNGSVELAPLLGLAPCIADLVETGNTLKANNLEVFQKLQTIKVYLIANPAYYKLHYREINTFIAKIREDLP